MKKNKLTNNLKKAKANFKCKNKLNRISILRYKTNKKFTKFKKFTNLDIFDNSFYTYYQIF